MSSGRGRLTGYRRCPSETGIRGWSATDWFTLAAVGLSVVYLIRFFSSSPLRLGIYGKLLGVYLFLPDALASDLMDLWVGGNWSDFGVGDRWPVWAMALWWTVTAWATGYLILPAGWKARWTAWERWLYSWGLGLQLWSLYTLLVGLGGGLRYHVFWSLPSATMVLLVLVVRLRHENWATVRGTVVRMAGGAWRWGGVGLPLLLIVFLAPLPPWEFDVREYHLQVPKEWYQAGRISFLPHNVYGNMPLGAEMHALACMVLWPGERGWWYGALAGKMLIGSFALLGALSIGLVIPGQGTSRAARWAATVYLSTPWVLHVSTVGLIEGAWAAYFMLAVAALWRAVGQPTMPTQGVGGEMRQSENARHACDDTAKWCALSGFFAGAAASCKYPALILVVLPLAAAVGVMATKRRFFSVATFALMAAVSVAPWYLKNLYFTGNPTYPLAWRIFDGSGWDEATNERWRRAHGPPSDAHGHRFHVHQLWDAVRDVGWESDKLSPLLWSLAFIGLAQPQARRLRWLFIYLVTTNFALWWLFTHRYDRFLVPVFPLVAVWAGKAADSWPHRVWWQSVLTIFLGCGVVLNCIVVSTGALTGDNRLLVKLDVLRRDEAKLLRTHPAHLYLNDHVPQGWAALMIGDAQAFDIEVPVYYHTCWNRSWWDVWMKNKTLEEQKRVLLEHRISHVFVHWLEIDRYRQPGNYGFSSDMTRERFHAEFVQTGLLRPVRVRSRDGWLDPRAGEVFEVTGSTASAPQP